jgi:hypothetical protein
VSAIPSVRYRAHSCCHSCNGGIVRSAGKGVEDWLSRLLKNREQFDTAAGARASDGSYSVTPERFLLWASNSPRQDDVLLHAPRVKFG